MGMRARWLKLVRASGGLKCQRRAHHYFRGDWNILIVFWEVLQTGPTERPRDAIITPNAITRGQENNRGSTTA